MDQPDAGTLSQSIGGAVTASVTGTVWRTILKPDNNNKAILAAESIGGAVNASVASTDWRTILKPDDNDAVLAELLDGNGAYASTDTAANAIAKP